MIDVKLKLNLKAIIISAGKHLMTLINDVLDLSKIESGKMDIKFEQVDVNSIVFESISLIQALAQTQQIDITDNISNKGYIIHADEIRCKQILINLLSNATKYNRQGGSIILDGEIRDEQRSGHGINKDQLTKLFMPFERLDKGSNIEGTGIGLAVTKHLIELMAGTIGIESTPGVGSTFWVEFKLAM